jgi:hypothetical protein
LEIEQCAGDGVVLRAAARAAWSTEAASSAASARATAEITGSTVGWESAAPPASALAAKIVTVALLVGRSEPAGSTRAKSTAAAGAKVVGISIRAWPTEPAATSASASPTTRSPTEAPAIVGAAEYIIRPARPAAAASPTECAVEIITGRDRLQRRIDRLPRRHHITQQRANHFPLFVGGFDVAFD